MEHQITLQLLDHAYTLIETTSGDWTGVGMGQSSMFNGKIMIQSTMPHDMRNSTIIHEIVHQISDILDLGIGEREDTVSGIAVGVYSFIKNNPELIREMLNKEIE